MIEIICLVTLSILILICIILQIKVKRRIIFAQEEYVVATKHLEMIINCYKTSVLEHKLGVLHKTHNLDKDSQFNAIKKFDEENNNLISECAKDILKNYVNDNSKIILAKYFSSDGLILFVITNLKG